MFSRCRNPNLDGRLVQRIADASLVVEQEMVMRWLPDVTASWTPWRSHESGHIRPTKEARMALELRPNCEFCDKDLPPGSAVARICSYECTFCAECVENKLLNVCPNCGGGFAPRPIRPATEWRPGLSIAKQPAAEKRRHLRYSLENIAEQSARVGKVAPELR